MSEVPCEFLGGVELFTSLAKECINLQVQLKISYACSVHFYDHFPGSADNRVLLLKILQIGLEYCHKSI